MQGDQLRTWAKIWAKASGGDKQDFLQAWRKATRDLDNPNARWRKVTGPISGTISVLKDNAWHAPLPQHWLSPRKVLVAKLDHSPFAPGAIAQYFEETLAKKAWAKAAAREGGTGLDKGEPNFEPAKRTIQWMRRHGHHKQAAALTTAVVGGVWCGARRADPMQRACPRCGCPTETLVHRYFRCPGIARLEDPHGWIASTRWMQAKTNEADLERYHCLFTRAIVPGELSDIKTGDASDKEIDQLERRARKSSRSGPLPPRS